MLKNRSFHLLLAAALIGQTSSSFADYAIFRSNQGDGVCLIKDATGASPTTVRLTAEAIPNIAEACKKAKALKGKITEPDKCATYDEAATNACKKLAPLDTMPLGAG
jgi:hypothetical protein